MDMRPRTNRALPWAKGAYGYGGIAQSQRGEASPFLCVLCPVLGAMSASSAKTVNC